MMELLSLILWGLAGVSLAFLLLLTQTWSVQIVSPDHPKRSTAIVIGGAILRWLITGVVLLLALSNSLWAMLVTFTGFIITRTLLIFLWQDGFFQKPLRIHLTKD